MDDDRIRDQVKRGIASAAEIGDDLAERAQTATAEAGGTIQDVATQTGRQVADTAVRTYEQGAQTAEYLRKQGAQAAGYVSRSTAEKPWIGLLIAGAIGYVIAYAIHAR